MVVPLQMLSLGCEHVLGYDMLRWGVQFSPSLPFIHKQFPENCENYLVSMHFMKLGCLQSLSVHVYMCVYLNAVMNW